MLDYAQICEIEGKIAEQTKVHAKCVCRRKKMENKYREQASAPPEEVDLKIRKARDSPQKNTLLQAIHDAFKKEQELVSDKQTSDEQLQSLRQTEAALGSEMANLNTQEQDFSGQVG